jgi:hypothetical protein
MGKLERVMNFSSAWMVLPGIQLLQAFQNTGITMTIQYGPATNPNQIPFMSKKTGREPNIATRLA